MIYAGRSGQVHRLAECVECGRKSGPYWRGWRAYRTDDPDTAEPPQLSVYCPTCADREFGPPRRRPLVDRRRRPRPPGS